MRIRSTKPEFWRSSRIASVDWDARLVLKALESYVDDNGVGKDDIALIVSDCFSRDLIREPSRTLARVSEALSALSAAGLLWRYTDDETDLLYVAFWEDVQRIDKPTKGRFRRPDGTLSYGDTKIRESSRGLQEPSRLEQRIRGSEEQGIYNHCASADAERDAAPTSLLEIEPDDLTRHQQQDRERVRRRDQAAYAEFDAWWAEYPRKRAKGQAMKAWKIARRKASATELLTGLRRQLPEFQSRPPDRVPYPATWLNGECWADQPAQPARQSSRVGEHMRLAAHLAEKEIR